MPRERGRELPRNRRHARSHEPDYLQMVDNYFRQANSRDDNNDNLLAFIEERVPFDISLTNKRVIIDFANITRGILHWPEHPIVVEGISYPSVMSSSIPSPIIPTRPSCAAIKYVDIMKAAENWLEENKPKPSDLTASSIDSICALMAQDLANQNGCDLTEAERVRFISILKSVFDDFLEEARATSEPTDNLRDKACFQTESLGGSGQKFSADLSGVITFLHEGQNRAECVSHSDWNNILRSAQPIAAWQPVYPKYPLGYAPVFKLPHSGVFVQANQEFLNTFTCYQLESIGIKPIGSDTGSTFSALHGSEEKLYSVKPIHLADMKAFIMNGTPIPVRDWLRTPFIPLDEDLTEQYKKWADKRAGKDVNDPTKTEFFAFIFTFNGQYIVEESKSGRSVYTTPNWRQF